MGMTFVLFLATLLLLSISTSSAFVISDQCTRSALSLSHRKPATRTRTLKPNSFINGVLSRDVHDRHRQNNNELLAKTKQNDDYNDYDDNLYDEWEAGDLQSDLKTLRSAVAKSNADTDLDEKERMHLLNEFANQRRELLPDVKSYILKPLLVAAFCISLSPMTNVNVSGVGKDVYVSLGRLLNYFRGAFFGTMNAVYYISLTVPLLLYHNTRNTRKTTNTLDQEPASMGNLVTLDADGGERECRDYSHCLLENWMSSIIFSTTLHSLMILWSVLSYGRYGYDNRIRNPVSALSARSGLFEFGLKLSRLTTRLGAAAALHQFPKLLYQLRRSNQPRPMLFLPTILKQLIQAYMYILPMGFAADIAQLCLFSFQSRGTYAVTLNSIMNGRLPLILSRMIYASLCLSIILPMAHLTALTKILKIGRFTNISLAMDQEKALALLNHSDTDGFALRYKLQWRPPTRLISSRKKLLRKLSLFVFTGWGEKASIVDDGTGSSNSKDEPLILTLLGKEMDNNNNNNNNNNSNHNNNLNSPNPKFVHRENWVRDSANSMANIHQSNYMNKNFNDPLGIAFQQTFGIGVSFDFDHNSKLTKNQSASIHRLRARAAKSAIKEYNAIPQMTKEDDHLQSIVDRDTREREYTRLVEKKKRDVRKVALEISTLISSNAWSPEGKDMDVFAMKQSEANQLESLSLPWLEDSDTDTSNPNTNVNSEDNMYDDPYLSMEDAFLYDLKRKSELVNVPDIDGEELFNSTKAVFT